MLNICNRLPWILLVCGLVNNGVIEPLASVSAQEGVTVGAAAPEHAFLRKFLGEWETISEATMGPDQPPMIVKGTMKGRMLGDFWLVSESQADAGDFKVNAILTIGFDQDKGRYIGTWVDNAMNHMWHYDGEVQAETITFNAEGPNMMVPGKRSKFQDIYRFNSADEVEIESRIQTETGEWITFMKGKSTRVKAPFAN